MEKLKRFIEENYNIVIDEITPILSINANIYKITSNNNSYIVKITEESGFNHPKVEPYLCQRLNMYGIKALRFLKSKDNSYSLEYDNKIINTYEYCKGTTVEYNSLPSNVVDNLASYLGKLNLVLDGYDLITGFDESYFQFMSVEKARNSYNATLELAKRDNQMDIVNDINMRLSLLNVISDFKFNLDKLTYKNSHGNFDNEQIIMDDDFSIIDFTNASKCPVILELSRLFFTCDESAKKGFDQNRFDEFISNYEQYVSLSKYDKQNILKLYFYTILVENNYAKYFDLKDQYSKNYYLKRAMFESSLLRNNMEIIVNLK